jgi:hypothetical protein
MKALLVALIATLALASQQAAAATPSKCASGEIGAAGKKAVSMVKCWTKATSKGVAVDSTCTTAAQGKFSTAYGKAQGKGDCPGTITATTTETTVDNFVTDLVSEIDGSTGTPTASKCSSKELTAAGKKAGAVLKCYAKAAAKGDPSLVAPCITTAQGKFGTAWTKAASAADCNTTVDQGTIETKVDNFAGDVNSQTFARWHEGDLTTYDQNFWGDPTASAASILEADYNTVYASTLGLVEVGIPGAAGFSMQFTSASNVIDYLPSTGAVGPLTADLANPTTGSSGAFGGNVLALQVNVDFADAGFLSASSGLKFGDLQLCGLTSDTDLNGKSARQVLALANTALGGGSTTDGISDLNTIALDLNDSFNAGTPSTFAQDHLFNGACP